MRNWLLIFALLATSACVGGASHYDGKSVASVTFKRSPGYWGGPSYQLDLAEDGKGRLEWYDKHPAMDRTRVRNFQFEPSQFAALEMSLAEFRPEQSTYITEAGVLGSDSWRINSQQCGEHIYHAPVITVTWRDVSGATFLQYDLGCDDERNKALIDVLLNEPKKYVPSSLTKLPIW